MNEFDGIAISSRIRLARNVSGFNFFTKLGCQDAEYITKRLSKILNDLDIVDISKLKDLPLNECNALLERHIISKELIENKDISAFALSEDMHIIVMLNEEDHIRLQCIYDGFDLSKPYKRIKEVDEHILREIDIAYNDEYGFITSSPSNLGTGMRASVMLFLPAIERRGEFDFVKHELFSKGFTLRGLYGEGSGEYGGFYQISNQNSLGDTEREILDKVRDEVYGICEMELSAREDLLATDHLALKDEIYRAYGVLKECASLESEEMIKLLSLLKFGGQLGFLRVDTNFDTLFVEGASANLKDKNLFDNRKESVIRAEYINKKIRELVSKEG